MSGDIKQAEIRLSQLVTVSIKELASSVDPPGCDLEYEVSNESHEPIWLVVDDWLIWKQRDRQIELSYARGKMSPGSRVFGYFPPAVLKVEPGRRVTRTVMLRWPQPLDRLWNVAPTAAPAPGEYRVSVRVGYGTVPAPELATVGEGVEVPVLRWQHEAVSNPVEMVVPDIGPRNE
jgi:hypothetical protein